MKKVPTVVAIGLVVASGVVRAQDWPQWRGPDGRRISSEQGLPTVWRAPCRTASVSMPGSRPDKRLVSSPAVSNGRIFIRTDQALVAVGP